MKTPDHPHNFTAHLVLGMLLLNLLVVVAAALAIRDDRIEHDRRARVTTQNTALLVERDVSAVFDRIDLALHAVVDEIEDRIAAGPVDEVRLNAFLKHQQSHLPEITSLRVTDSTGLLRYGEGVAPGVAVTISDREHFILQRDNPKAGLIIAKPVQSKTSQTWIIPASRRINRPDGGFAGVVYVGVPVTYFVKQFASLDLGAHGLVALRSADHLSMARYPQAQEGGAIGQFALSEQLRSLLKNKPTSVTYVAPSPVDRDERVYTYHKAAVYPLYVIVGLATQDYLDSWRRDAAQTAAVVLLFSLMTAFFAWVISRSWRRQLATSEALRASEERWSFALEGGGYCVWDWDLTTGQVSLSKRGKQMFGFADDEIGDDIAEWAARAHPDDRARVLADLKRHLRGDTPEHATEYRVRHKDGRWRWILSRGMVVSRNPQGRVLRMIGTHVDVTERREREETLRLDATVFEILDEAVIVTNEKNDILSVNPAFTAITGYAPEEVIGRNPRLLSAKTHSKAFYQALWQTLAETGSWSGEVMNRKKSGEAYIEWLSLKRLLDDAGRVTHHVAVFTDITVRKAAQERIRHLALHDALTDLPNRALLTERLEQAIIRARREQSCLALLYFDLDKFKPVNDNFGHAAGDLLLQAVAGRVVDCVRASDTVARIGGDEFVVLLSTLEEDKDAWMVAEKIRAALSQPFEIAGHVFDISASIGLAIYPEHGGDEQTLTRHADAAMYQAKKSGRNQVVRYRTGM